jgi:uncharacterized protein (TIRG00374 family)
VKKPIIITSLFAVGVIILVVLFHVIDVQQSIIQIGRIGLFGSLLFVLNIGLTFLAPSFGWHLLMRAEGINITFRQTATSALMGHAFNLITPMMYVGGEPIRVFHVAGMCNISKRRVLATIIVSKFQEVVGLALFMIFGTAVTVLTARDSLKSVEIIAAIVTGFVLIVFLIVLTSLVLGNVQPTVKILDFLIKKGLAKGRIEHIRQKAVEMELLVRDAFIHRWKLFLVSQALTLISPLAQFLRPLIFYACLRWGGGDVPLPSFQQLAMLFVFSQVLYMAPSTPGGLGIYEGGIVLIFVKILAWPESDGAAFALLVRAADLIYIAFGVWLVVHYGMTSLLKSVLGTPGSAPINMETKSYRPINMPPPQRPDGDIKE